MGLQFLDERISVAVNFPLAGTTIPVTPPILIGDIGLQTGAAVSAGNAGKVRVALHGSVGIRTVEKETSFAIAFVIERGGGSALGAGTIIWGDVFRFESAITLPLPINAADFPPADAVSAGEIRYTLFVFAQEKSGEVLLRGPVTFNGVATAGTS